MIRHPLTLTIAAVLLIGAGNIATPVSARTTTATQQAPPTSAHIGLVSMDHLQALLQGDTAAVLANDAGDTTLHTTRPSIGWVDSAALDDAATVEILSDMFMAGLPILTTRTHQTPRSDHEKTRLRELFGASSDSRQVIYRRMPNGALGLITVDESTSSTDMTRAATTITASLAELDAKSVEIRNDVTEDEVAKAWAPRIEIYGQLVSTHPQGNATRYAVEVSRDTTPSRDVYKVISKVDFTLQPFQNGYHVHDTKYGRQDYLAIPKWYEAHQTLRGYSSWNSSEYAAVVKDHFPHSTAETDFAIDETRTSESGFGLGIGGDVAKDLQKTDPTAAAKGAFSLSWGWSKTKSTSISFGVKDYSLAVGQSSGLFAGSTWRYNLSPAVRNYVRGDGTVKNMADRMTPAMKHFAPSAYSEWEVPIHDGMVVQLSMSSTVRNEVYGGLIIPNGFPDPNAPLPFQPDSFTEISDAEKQPRGSIDISVETPFLAKETVSLIKSNKGNGGCLWDQNGVVKLLACPPTADVISDAVRSAHWQFDSEGRYYNRGTKRCIAVPSPTSSRDDELITEPCTLVNAQRWVWYADRIHSLYNGADNDWRMYVDANDAVRAKPAGYDSIPVNGTHPLLAPWSTYPGKPVEGATIPTFSGPQPAIPPSWLSLRAVGADQRWDVTPLRIGLDR